MTTPVLEIRNLHARIEDREILKGVNLIIPPGEVHAIMGRNGSGKSTLSYVLAGKEDYEITEGEILLNGESILEMEPDEWAAQLDTNVNALYHVTRAVLPGMVERGRGYVITIGSLAGRNTFAGGTAYTGTKHFVNGWTESLMLEVRDHGVKVSVVMPGSVTTHFNDHVPSDDDAWKLRTEDVAETVAHIIATPPNVLVHRAEVRTLNVPKGRAR